MARLEDIPEKTRERLISLECPSFPVPDWAPVDDLASRTVAIISSAGIHTRDATPFKGGDGHYAAIPDATPDADILMSHVSINYDRTGFQRDLDVIFPRRALHTLKERGTIGEVGKTHYSFMGATDPREMEADARDLASKLKGEGTDTALLVPV